MRELNLTPLEKWDFFSLPRPCTIAGPCSAESEEQVMQTARELRELGINVFRAGIWKPRTHPGSFEGVGIEGLEWMKKAKDSYGLKICTEVAGARHVEECLRFGVDMVWIGARTTSNPFLMQEIAETLAGSDLPVLVKNPMNPDLDLWIGALERLNAEGITKLGVIHRGFSSLEKIKYRNSPEWQMAIELKKTYPVLPMFCDPSHMAGKREFIKELSQRALDLGFDGLMVESHCNPSCALSDAAQQLKPRDLVDMLYSLNVSSASDPNSFNRELSQMREHIDVLDEELLKILSKRMNICREIGRIKRDNNVTVVQSSRWAEVLESAVNSGSLLSLDRDFIRDIFNRIHDQSVAEQREIQGK